MAIAYFYSIRLSENIAKTDEGYLICRDAVIARTGFQQYLGKELPADQLRKLGVTVAAGESVNVYRPPEEVFRTETIASFEGKPITDGHPDGDEFVDSENIAELQQGHIQNVRKGTEPLESGEWPLIADILITHADLVRKVETDRLRELSGGYNYNLGLDVEQLIQKDIRGNHVALVPKGRAGQEARIKDSAPPEPVKQSRKDYHVSKGKAAAFFQALGFQAWAKDAKPEEVAEKIEELKADSPNSRAGEAAKDADAHEDKPVKAEKAEDKKAKDTVDPEREKMHAALDKVLDKKAKDRKAEDAKSEDADLEKLKELLGEFFDEEEEEPQHEDDADEDESEEEAEDADGDGKEEHERESELVEGKDCKVKDGKAKDGLLVQPISAGKKPAAASEGAFVLNALRPFVARAKDAKLCKAFDAIAEQVNKSGKREGKGGYGAFGKAASNVDKDSVARAKDASGVEESNASHVANLNAMMAKHHRKNMEVK